MDPQTLLQFFCTAALTGLIWTIQIVTYPGYAEVPARGFVEYHARYMRRITFVVAPLMLAELGLALALFFDSADFHASSFHATGGLILVAVIWLSTAFLQVPAHRRLERSHDVAAIRSLVRSNWIRTLAWTARSALLGDLLVRI